MRTTKTTTLRERVSLRNRFFKVSVAVTALCAHGVALAQTMDEPSPMPSGQQFGQQLGQRPGQQPAQFDYGVSLGAGYSDNILRTSANKQDETYASAGLDLTFKDDSRLLYSNSAIDVAYLNYLRNTFSDEVIGNANINLTGRIVPGTFEWLLLDNFGQVRSDPFAPVTPDNRENINYFTTGPQFTAHLGNTMRAQLGGHYSKISYERSNTDNDRYGANAALIRDLSSTAHASVNVDTERTNYSNDSIGTDYDTSDAYFDFTLTGARTKAIVDLGYTQIKRGGEKLNGTLIRLQLERKLTPSTQLTLRGGRELTSSGDVFRSDQSAQPVSLDAQLTTTAIDPLVRKYIDAGWSFARARTSFGVDVGWAKETHEQQTALDRKDTTANAYVSRQITPNLSAQLSANYVKEDYDTAQVDSKETSEALSFAWRVGKLLTTTFQLQHYSRSGNVPNTDYDENRVWLQFIYGTARPMR